MSVCDAGFFVVPTIFWRHIRDFGPVDRILQPTGGIFVAAA